MWEIFTYVHVPVLFVRAGVRARVRAHMLAFVRASLSFVYRVWGFASLLSVHHCELARIICPVRPSVLQSVFGSCPCMHAYVHMYVGLYARARGRVYLLRRACERMHA